MSRLGDLIHTERLRQNMTPKQVARKCGVSESYIIAVENGSRIIADDQARRILKKIGLTQQTEADFTLDEIAATVDLAQVQPGMQPPAQKPAPKPKPEAEKVASTETEVKDETVTGSIWLDALSGVLKHVPIMNAAMKEVGHRLLPITNGKIEGANPDKVYYMMAPDNDLRGFRVMKGDLLLVVPAQAPVDGAIMVLDTPYGKILRKTIAMPNYQVMLQKFDQACESEITNLNAITCVGRCVRLEAELA